MIYAPEVPNALQSASIILVSHLFALLYQKIEVNCKTFMFLIYRFINIK